jgi:hypothetical protein
MGRRFDRIALPVMNGICGAMAIFRNDEFEAVGCFGEDIRAVVPFSSIRPVL